MASSTLTSVRIDNKLLEWLKEYSEFQGVSTNKMLTEILQEKMEDDLDYQDAIKSIKASEGQPTYTLAEIKELNGL